MTQIAILPPAAPQLPPAGSPPAGSGSQDFSRHFDKAIAERKDQLSPRDNRNAKPDAAQEEETSPATLTGHGGQETAAAVPPGQDVARGDAAEPAAGQLDQDPGSALPIDIYPAAMFIPPNTAGAATNAALSGQWQPAAVAGMIAAATGSQGKTISPVVAEEGPAVAAPADTLLAQLQNIIESSDEMAQVSITREPSPSTAGESALSAQRAWQPLENSISMTMTSQYARMTSDPAQAVPVPGGSAAADAAGQDTSLRQNTQQQYFEAKINLQAFDSQDGSLAQDRQQDNDPAAQAQVTSGQNALNPTPVAGEQTNTFAQPLAALQTSPALPATDAAKTLTLPSGVMVREDDVIQQVLERFQISRRPLDTQINIKLHPAELGELKIDLTVKEGSIRASVVAQSQQAQEIIEKNMTKLRTVLEDHGFTIEHITVSAKHDSTTDAGLFDRQLFSQNDYTPQTNRRRHDSEGAFPLDEAFFPAQPATAGVNVKI